MSLHNIHIHIIHSIPYHTIPHHAYHIFHTYIYHHTRHNNVYAPNSHNTSISIHDIIYDVIIHYTPLYARTRHLAAQISIRSYHVQFGIVTLLYGHGHYTNVNSTNKSGY